MKKFSAFIVLILSFVACSPSEEELFGEGIARLDSQDYTEAISYFERVIEINPNHTSAHNAKGVAYFELRNWDKAIEAFDASIAADSSSYKPFFNRGNAYLEKQKFTEAVIDYNYANGLDPQQKDIYYNRGLALLGMESYEDAIVDFDMALQANPNQPQVYFNKAKAQLGNNNPLGALESLTNSVALDQSNSAAYYLLGITQLSALEQKEEGCANLKMALSLGYSGAKDWLDKFCEN